MSHWVKTAASSASLAHDCATAIQQAREAPGHIATLIAPADTAWGPSAGPVEAAPATPQQPVASAA